ncbi:MAG: hypothetical protein U0451_02210 [Candidatus Saccharimonadales bacterium]
MINALFWGLFAASSLLIGAGLAIKFNLSQRTIGIIMAFGVGVLISAVAYELTEEAFHTVGADSSIVIGLVGGALTFYIGNSILTRKGAGKRKNSKSIQHSNSPLAIVLGSILDGIPESIVLGLGLVKGGTISYAMLIAVFLSNLPEAISATSGLIRNGWKNFSILLMWSSVVAVSGIASLAGFVVMDQADSSLVAFTLSFSAGALLTMITDTMIPEAYDNAGSLTGIVTTLGFGLAFWLSIL